MAHVGEGPTHEGVGIHNWRLPPYNRWAFWHVKDILGTTEVKAATVASPLSPYAGGVADPLAQKVVRVDGTESTPRDILADTYTDAFVVIHDGALVAEWYGPEGAPERTHALMSVTKSIVSCVAAALVDREILDVSIPVNAYVPELADSGYAEATVSDVLDMRSGVRFREDYKDPDADIRRLALCEAGIYSYLTDLKAEAPHGQRFLYRSAETDVLGWVCERVSGLPMAKLISTLIWQPIGAEFDAEIITDTTGTAYHDGGLCATARDVARFGQLLLEGGTAVDSAGAVGTVIGPRWLRESSTSDAESLALFADSPAGISMPGGWYRNQFWFRPGGFGDVLLCLGIHGQMIHVSRRTRTVCVKFSTWPEPQRPGDLQDTLRAFDNVGGVLSGHYLRGRNPRLPGIASGVNRHGVASRSADIKNL
ncbi:serine hydrolase domain-containing protein [Mycolicibacterium sphagni]|uniref:Serine hydrolase n=1 Tax=Mycolicibacterium sphagni TaxID=1786 RepID=A0ABX2JUC5_9MYCO|nr:serine hydrolase [Mycolicibacterium sphagni]NTY60447.1 serine hydrolase [Mycolicibacterium sphagni]